MDIPSAIARLAALVEFLAGVEASADEERAVAQDARIIQARAARVDLEQAIAHAYGVEVLELGVQGGGAFPVARAVARTRRLELEARLALVAMRLERAIIDYGHAYAIAAATGTPL